MSPHPSMSVNLSLQPQTPNSTDTSNRSANGRNGDNNQNETNLGVNRGSSLNNLLTPSFSFGLSFSPSFSFNTPNPIVTHSFSSSSSSNRNLKPFINIPTKNDFLESLNKINKENNRDSGSYKDNSVSTNIDASNNMNDDLWSNINDSEQTNNTTVQSNENDKSILSNINSKDEFLTPNKLVKSLSPNLLKEGRSYEKPMTLQNSLSNISNSSIASPRNTLEQIAKKRRRSSTLVQESPNNSIASKIDSAMASPITYRKSSLGLSQSASTTNLVDDKVWNSDLDECLIKSFYKYKKFKEDSNFNQSSILKKTSQNKVLSRMMYNRTGQLRTSSQISSRIFRLVKAGKLIKDKIATPSSTNTSQQNSISNNYNLEDDVILTPLEDLINSNGDSIQNNAILDRELDLLLASSPLDEVFEKKLSSSLTNDYALEMTKFELNLKNSSNNLLHCFTTLSNSKPLTSTEWISVPFDLADDATIWKMNHDLNLSINQFATSTPSSAISPKFVPHPLLNVSNAVCESYMKIKVSTKCEDQSILNWFSHFQVFKTKNNEKLFETTEFINGYLNHTSDTERTRTYTLNVPFLKSFLFGYINFLVNGSIISKDENLKIIQVIFDNKDSESSKFDERKSIVHGYIIHELNVAGSTSCSRITRHERNQKLEDRKSKGEGIPDIEIEDLDEADDNETVIAESSPYKSSPINNNATTPCKKRNLKIEIEKANMQTINTGPMTAPIFNAKIVQQHVAYERPPQQRDFINYQPNRIVPPAPQAPPLMHSQSAGNIVGINGQQTMSAYDWPGNPYQNNYSQILAMQQQQIHNFNGYPAVPPQPYIAQQFASNKASREEYIRQQQLLQQMYQHQMNQNYTQSMTQQHYQQHRQSQDQHYHLATRSNSMDNKENIRPKNSFGPILEFDPSTDIKTMQK